MSQPAVVLSAVQRSLDATNTYGECREEGKSTLECTATTTVSQIHHVGQVLAGVDFYNECKANGNSIAACVLGTVVNDVAARGTEAMSTALIIGAPITPLPPVALATGVTGIMRSSDIGRAAGELTIQLANYLVDNVPADAIDHTQILTISNGLIVVEYQPDEVEFIKSIISARQEAKQLVSSTTAALTSLTNSYQEFEHRFHANQGQYDTSLGRVSLGIDQISSLCESLRTIHTNSNLIERLTQPMRNDYAERQAEAVRHNEKNTTTTASVGYDSSSKTWSISFSVNVGYGRSGGGFSCVLL